MIITEDVMNRINDMVTGELSSIGYNILKFEKTGTRYVKVETDTSKSPEACAGTLEFVARFFDVPHIKAVVLEDEVFLINTKIA